MPGPSSGPMASGQRQPPSGRCSCGEADEESPLQFRTLFPRSSRRKCPPPANQRTARVPVFTGSGGHARYFVSGLGATLSHWEPVSQVQVLDQGITTGGCESYGVAVPPSRPPWAAIVPRGSLPFRVAVSTCLTSPVREAKPSGLISGQLCPGPPPRSPQGLALPSGPPPCTPLGVSPLTLSFLGPGRSSCGFPSLLLPGCQLPEEGPQSPRGRNHASIACHTRAAQEPGKPPSCSPPSLPGPEGRLIPAQAREDLTAPRELEHCLSRPPCWGCGTVFGHLEEGEGDDRTVATLTPQPQGSGVWNFTILS